MLELQTRKRLEVGLMFENIVPNRRIDYNLKYYLRDIAKNHEEYRIPVTITPYVTGRDDDGNKIEINTLGRWLFGLPGYMGHIRVLTDPDSDYVIIEVPEGVDIAEKLLIDSANKLGLKFLYKYDLVSKEKIEYNL